MVQLNPSDFSTEQLDRFLFAVMGRINVHFINGVEKPLTRVRMAEYLDVTPDQVDKLRKAGVLTGHRLTDGGEYRYFASEAYKKYMKS
jgi:hypothetical protein